MWAPGGTAEPGRVPVDGPKRGHGARRRAGQPSARTASARPSTYRWTSSGERRDRRGRRSSRRPRSPVPEGATRSRVPTGADGCARRSPCTRAGCSAHRRRRSGRGRRPRGARGPGPRRPRTRGWEPYGVAAPTSGRLRSARTAQHLVVDPDVDARGPCPAASGSAVQPTAVTRVPSTTTTSRRPTGQRPGLRSASVHERWPRSGSCALADVGELPRLGVGPDGARRRPGSWARSRTPWRWRSCRRTSQR